MIIAVVAAVVGAVLIGICGWYYVSFVYGKPKGNLELRNWIARDNGDVEVFRHFSKRISRANPLWGNKKSLANSGVSMTAAETSTLTVATSPIPEAEEMI